MAINSLYVTNYKLTYNLY